MNPTDPTVLANLQLAYRQISTQIVNVSASPNMSFSENGRTVSQTEYLAMLIDKQESLLKAIQMAGGPIEVCG